MSSGKEGYGTPKGTYKIIQKDANYKSGTYGVLRSRATGAVVNSDYGMHVGFVTGYPVSHGCVRLPADMAKTFFENTPLGTKVTIR